MNNTSTSIHQCGISITDVGVYCIALGDGRLRTYGFYPLDPLVVSEGDIRHVPTVTSVLRRIAQEHQIKSTFVTIPDERVYIFETHIPNPEFRGQYYQAKISDLVLRAMRDVVPAHVQSTYFDYTVVKNDRNAEDIITVVVRVMHEKLAELYKTMFTAAGIEILGFKAESQAIADAVVHPDNTETVVCAHIGEARSVFGVVRGNVVRHSSVLSFGVREMRDVLAKELDLSDLDVSVVLAGGAVRGVHHEQVVVALVNVLSVFRDELIRFAEKGEVISKVILSGTPAALMGLTKYMTDSFKISTHAANVWGNACTLEQYVPDLQFSDALEYVAAIGAALHKQ